MLDPEVHAFLRQIDADELVDVGPREHLLVSRLLQQPPPPQRLGVVLGALLGTRRDQVSAIEGAWARWWADLEATEDTEDAVPPRILGPRGEEGAPAEVPADPDPYADPPPKRRFSPGQIRLLVGVLGIALSLAALGIGLAAVGPDPEVDVVAISTEPVVPESTAADPTAPPPEPTAADPTAPPPEPTAADPTAPPPDATATDAAAPPTGTLAVPLTWQPALRDEASVVTVDRPVWDPPGTPLQLWLLATTSLMITGIGAGLLAVVGHAPGQRRRLDRRAEAARKELRGGSQVLPVLHLVDPVIPFPPAVLDAVASELGRIAHAEDGEAWDMDRTVEASARQAGRLAPRYTPRRHGVPLLVLVDREEGDHPFLHVYGALLDLWDRRGLVVERWDFTGWVEGLHNPHGERTTLTELARRRGDAYVMVLTRLHGAFPMEGPQVSWVARLTPWRGQLVLLDPDPRPLADRVEGALPEGAPPHLPLSQAGLFAMARWFQEGGEAKAAWPAYRFPGETTPDRSRALDAWAAIATVVPRPRWAHLDDLRRTFLPELDHWSDVVVLLEHLRQGMDDQGVALDTDRGCRDKLEDLQRQPEGRRLVRRVHSRLKTQLQARAAELDQAGEHFAANVAHLKVAIHDAALGEQDLRQVVEDYLGTGVQPELERLVDDEVGLEVSLLDREQLEEAVDLIGGRAATGDTLGRLDRDWLGLTAVVGLAMLGTSWVLWLHGRGVAPTQEVIQPPSWHLVPREPKGVTATAMVTDAPPAFADTSAPMRFVRLPGGSFTMGSPPGEGDDDEHPAHVVTVSAFDVAVTEVTQGQWFAVLGDRPSDCEHGCGDDLPVQGVSWNDAVRFLDALSAREGLQPCYGGEGQQAEAWRPAMGCSGYRLPTEAEWEYAARAGTPTAWSWGDDAAGAEAHAWFGEPFATGEVHPVAAVPEAAVKAANPWGLHDMHGNVWEWVWDAYDAQAYRHRVASPDGSVAPDDPVVASSGIDLRVVRGGAFSSVSSWLRSANRDWDRPSDRDPDVGLRCVRSPPSSSSP